MTRKSESRVKRDREVITAFHDLVIRCIPLTNTISGAYEMAEDLHMAASGEARFYKNYMSFANTRKYFRKFIKNKRR